MILIILSPISKFSMENTNDIDNEKKNKPVQSLKLRSLIHLEMEFHPGVIMRITMEPENLHETRHSTPELS